MTAPQGTRVGWALGGVVAAWLAATPALLAQSSGKPVLLDGWLAESDGLSIERPGPLHQGLIALPSAPKLMARALVDPEAMAHLSRAFLDPRRSVQQRVYALFLLAQTPWDDRPWDKPLYPSAGSLLGISRDVAHPLLQVAALRIAESLSLRGRTCGFRSKEEIEPYESVYRRNPWGQCFTLDRRDFPIDARLVRELIAVLPERPYPSRSPPDTEFLDLTPRASATDTCTRIESFFQARATATEAIPALIAAWPGLSPARRALVMWAFYGWTQYPSQRRRGTRQAITEELTRQERLQEEQIAALARELLLTQTRFGFDPGAAVRVLARRGESQDCHAIALALRQLQGEAWKDDIRSVIEHDLLWLNRWPRHLPLSDIWGREPPPSPPDLLTPALPWGPAVTQERRTTLYRDPGLERLLAHADALDGPLTPTALFRLPATRALLGRAVLESTVLPVLSWYSPSFRKPQAGAYGLYLAGQFQRLPGDRLYVEHGSGWQANLPAHLKAHLDARASDFYTIRDVLRHADEQDPQTSRIAKTLAETPVPLDWLLLWHCIEGLWHGANEEQSARLRALMPRITPCALRALVPHYEDIPEHLRWIVLGGLEGIPPGDERRPLVAALLARPVAGRRGPDPWMRECRPDIEALLAQADRIEPPLSLQQLARLPATPTLLARIVLEDDVGAYLAAGNQAQRGAHASLYGLFLAFHVRIAQDRDELDHVWVHQRGRAAGHAALLLLRRLWPGSYREDERSDPTPAVERGLARAALDRRIALDAEVLEAIAGAASNAATETQRTRLRRLWEYLDDGGSWFLDRRAGRLPALLQDLIALEGRHPGPRSRAGR